MGIEDFEKIGGDPESEFRNYWKKKAENWIQAIRMCKIPQYLEETITGCIEEMFVKDYLQNKAKNPLKLEAFRQSCYSILQDDVEADGETKKKIYEMINSGIKIINAVNEN